VVVSAFVAGAAVMVTNRESTATDATNAAAVPPVNTAALVGAVPDKSVAKIDPARLASGVVPPTNRWYSGLVFGDEPQPVFAEPLSFGLTDSGFTLGLPDPTVSEKTIIAPHVPALTVDVGAASAQVTKADPVSVTIALLDGSGKTLGNVVVAEGSPFVSFTASTDVSAQTTGGTFQGKPATAHVGDTDWGLVGGTTKSGTTALTKGQSATWYALPAKASSKAKSVLADAAKHPVTGVDVAYAVDGDTARTSLTYRSDGKGAYVLMPHQRTGDQPKRADCGLGSYPSVYGDLELCAGSTLTSYAPKVTPTRAFDLDGITDDERAAITSAVTADVAATPAFPSDTYFGGKALNRAATLVVLGEQLDVDVADLRTKTEDALRDGRSRMAAPSATPGAWCTTRAHGRRSA